MNGVYMIEFWVFTFVITGNCLLICVTDEKLNNNLPCVYCVCWVYMLCLCFFFSACHFVRNCKVSVIVSDVTAQATSDWHLSFHLAAVMNSVYMMKLTQEQISKCSVVRDKKQCHLIKLLSKHMVCLIFSHFGICWFAKCMLEFLHMII